MSNHNKHLNIDSALKLLNSKTTTVEQLCKFIIFDIEKFRDERELFYLKQFKKEYNSKKSTSGSSFVSDEELNTISREIESDVKTFAVTYAQNSIDIILDAKNQNKIKSKKCFESIMVLLSTLKEMNEDRVI